MQPTTVDCRCGKVRLHLSEAPVAQFYCHCEDCRAVTGGAYAPLALFPAGGVTVSGGDTATSTYRTTPRTRCAHCGTLLFGEPPGMGVRGVSGFLLPAELFKPAFHIHCQRAVAPVKDGLPHFKDMPAAFGGCDEVIGW
ncbi:GFA family protein [Variovorax paradoxus]|uniref:GFA family protein n=1 Tax=Variovorax paradoxus TaxID=34073 RepID=UPI000782F055|nr:GFA family protein [Variovorax paradoxus]